MDQFKTVLIVLLILLSIFQQLAIEKSEILITNYSNRFDEAMQTIDQLQSKE